MQYSLDQLNAMPHEEAHAAFMLCCGSSMWANAMCASRPFSSINGLLVRADEVWRSLSMEDYIEAFGHHPRIGDTRAAADQFDATRKWSQAEQSAMAFASDDVRESLARGNEAYFDKFGFVFLICASGRTAGEMLDALERRLGNDQLTEIRNAAEQQRLITRLRLEKLLHT